MKYLQRFNKMNIKKKVELYQSFYKIGMIVMSNFLIEILLLVDPKHPQLVMDIFPKKYITNLKKIVSCNKLIGTGHVPRICQLNSIKKWLRIQNY